MILRALTLWRPWAASIVHGPKRVENRPWAPPLRFLDDGLWLALHAGRVWDGGDARYIRDHWPEIPGWVAAEDVEREVAWPELYRQQGVVGVARVVRAYRIDDLEKNPWAFGPWCWELADVRRLEEPIAVRGAQGLWGLPREIEEELWPMLVTA